MNLKKSGWRNQRMMNLKMDITRMANAIKPMKFGGYTLRGMKMGPTYKDGANWRAICIKCCGEGNLDPSQVPFNVKEIDVRGRIEVCFACDGKGNFPIPSPVVYKEFIILWIMGKVEEGKFEEIARVCNSEIRYITSLGRNHGWEAIPYEIEMGKFWRWVQRRLEAVNEGAPFFTALGQKFVNRYNTLLAHESMNGKEDDEEEDCDNEYDIDREIEAAFARLEALLA